MKLTQSTQEQTFLKVRDYIRSIDSVNQLSVGERFVELYKKRYGSHSGKVLTATLNYIKAYLFGETVIVEL